MPVRTIGGSDYAAMNRLLAGVGWPTRSQDGWRWLENHPARLERQAPMGWVAVDDHDQPVAMLGNFVQRFHHGSRRLFGATGYSIIVPPERMGASRGLIRALMGQPDMFAFYTFNANPRAAPLYRLFGLKAWPDGTHDLKLSWVTDRLACIQGRALRLALGRTSAQTAARLGEQLMNRRLHRAPALRLADDVVVLSDLGDRSAYAEFWRELLNEGRLLADRSPGTMRWRVSDPDATTPPLILACVRDGAIVGIAMAMMTKTSLIEPPCLEILDLIALKRAGDAIRTLCRALVLNAHAMGAAKVKLETVTPELLDDLGELAGAARREGGWGHCHARIEDAALAAAWSPTPFDGDYGVCGRPVPPGKQKSRRPSETAAALDQPSEA